VNAQLPSIMDCMWRLRYIFGNQKSIQGHGEVH
jgi:hypothetical protein